MCLMCMFYYTATACIYTVYSFYSNLFKAKHMYTCHFFFSKKWDFFTDKGLEWPQD